MSWSLAQSLAVTELKEMKNEGKVISMAGDGKYDSPGWAAKYCTYIVQSLQSKKIVGLWVAEKSMASSSSKLEPLAAKSIIVNLATEHGLVMDSITTDRSSDLKAMMSNIHADLPADYPQIIHQYDVWHWIKAVQKDLWAAAKLVSCQALNDWMTSITNMMWWSFSSSIGNVKMLKEKLGSITGHMANVHHFPENSEFRECGHADDAIGGVRTKAWLNPNSLALTKVVTALHGHQNNRWNDLEMMTQFTHTGRGNCWFIARPGLNSLEEIRQIEFYILIILILFFIVAWEEPSWVLPEQ